MLESWNDGDTKSAILEFVRSVTTPGDSFVPPAERIATFDNDGTLWCEKPNYVQADFLMRTAPAGGRAAPRGARARPGRAGARGRARQVGRAVRSSAGPRRRCRRGDQGHDHRGVRGHGAGVLRHGDPPDSRRSLHATRLPSDGRAARPAARTTTSTSTSARREDATSCESYPRRSTASHATA